MRLAARDRFGGRGSGLTRPSNAQGALEVNKLRVTRAQSLMTCESVVFGRSAAGQLALRYQS